MRYERVRRLTGLIIGASGSRLPAFRAAEVGVVVAPDLLAAVAADLPEQGLGEDDRDDGLGEDAGGGEGADVAAVEEGLDRLLRGEVHRLERRAERGQGLHRGADDDRLAVRHPALEAAGVVGLALEAALGVEQDLVVDARAGAPRGLEAEAELAALDRLDRAERLREPAVEPSVPLHVRAEAHQAPDPDHLQHAAERVALLLRRAYRRAHRRLGRGIGAADLGRLRAPPDLLPGEVEVGGDTDAADLRHVREDRGPELAQEPLAPASPAHPARLP